MIIMDTSTIFLSINQIVAFKFFKEQKTIRNFLKELNYSQKNKNRL